MKRPRKEASPASERRLDRRDMAAWLDTMAAGETAMLRVTGHSMMPTLLDHVSVVRLERVGDYMPRVGDVVLFLRPEEGRFVLHRICDVDKDGVITVNGDGQTWCERIRTAQIVGRVMQVRRRHRWVPVDRPSWRLWSAVWGRMRPLHRAGACGCYYWHRLPYRLGLKKAGGRASDS